MKIKGYRQMTAILLSAAMLMQSGGTVFAEEASQQTVQAAAETEEAKSKSSEEKAEEKATEKKEPETQPPTEAQTQPPTEAQTQAPTEAQTQAPTEAQTQAPTEAQTQAPTEAQTQAPTEAQTQPSETSTEAQTPSAEETKSPSDDQKKETDKKKKKKKQKETERSERKNDGEKISLADLKAKLEKLLPWLFAAETVEGISEEEADTLAIADGEEGLRLLTGMSEYSLSLANAKSSSDVSVINLYADEKGKLDEAQLKKKFENRVIDVTKKYCIVNVIADSAQQNLSFSDYELVRSGEPVSYEEAGTACDIIYNFAAMDGEEFTAYKGTVTLTSGSGLQGTFLAPDAVVETASDLYGAVYAKKITVNGAEKLQQAMFATEAKADETEAAETEAAETAETAESVTEAAETETTETEAAETETAETAESVTEAAETEAAETAETAESVTEAAETETTETEAAETEATETEMEETAESVTEAAETEATETETVETAESVTEAAAPETEELQTVDVDLTEYDTPDTSAAETSGTECDDDSALPEELLLALDTSEDSEEISLFAETGNVLQVKLADQDGNAVSGTVSVRAADEILDLEGEVLYQKDAEAASWTSEAGETAHEFGEALNYTGAYYLEVTAADTYCAMPRIYFDLTPDGVVLRSANAGWDAAKKLLTVTLYQADAEDALKLTLTDADDPAKALSDGEFVIRDQNNRVVRYIAYTGRPAALNGLADGTYTLSQVRAQEGYQIADDRKFTVPSAEKELQITNKAVPADSKTLRVSAQVLYQKTVLTAEEEQNYYAALFTGAGSAAKRVSGVQKLVLAAGQTASEELSFQGVAAGTYTLTAVDEFGYPLAPSALPYQLPETEAAADDQPGRTMMTVTVGAEESEKQVILPYTYKEGSYPENSFSYQAEITLTKKVLGHDGKALKTNETFHANLYRDKELTSAVNETPILFAMGGSSSQTVSYSLKMTEAEAVYYLAETDVEGKAVRPGDGFAYAVTYPSNETGEFTVRCGEKTGLQIRNKLNDSVVKIQVEDEKGGQLLAGAELVIKDSSKKVLSINNTKKFESEDQAIVWTNLLEDGETYYLSEVKAPDGYTPSPDVKFTVKSGKETKVVLKNAAVKASDYVLTVKKQVYSGDHQLYAYDTTDGAYAAKGAYTYYAALFSDAKRTKKISDVQKIQVTGFEGTAEFKNLKKGETYYVAETNEFGQVLGSTDSRSIRYSAKGSVTMSEKTRTSLIQNVYSSRRAGYRYTGALTLKLNVTDSAGNAEKVTKTFYAGIYRTPDYSDKPSVVKFDLNGASTASVRRRILLSGDKDMTYYIAQVDAAGNRITDESQFEYTVSIDQTAVTVTKSSEKTVTITDTLKSSKATLYLTKRVYEGTEKKAVNETFYVGLFKDPEFKELYTKPVPMKLENKSELTLKLSLNLGSSAGKTVYVAEVDENGRIIRNQSRFGYEIRLVNSTAVFTPECREIQTILINTVYGSVDADGWNQIFEKEKEHYMSGGDFGDGFGGGSGWYGGGFGGGWFDDDAISGNGEGGSVQTGDETQVFRYVLLLAASVMLGCIVLLLGKRRKYQ